MRTIPCKDCVMLSERVQELERALNPVERENKDLKYQLDRISRGEQVMTFTTWRVEGTGVVTDGRPIAECYTREDAERIVREHEEHERFRLALVGLAELQREKPDTGDFEHDDVGARAHAVAMTRWFVSKIARTALGETVAPKVVQDILDPRAPGGIGYDGGPGPGPGE